MLKWVKVTPLFLRERKEISEVAASGMLILGDWSQYFQVSSANNECSHYYNEFILYSRRALLIEPFINEFGWLCAY